MAGAAVAAATVTVTFCVAGVVPLAPLHWRVKVFVCAAVVLVFAGTVIDSPVVFEAAFPEPVQAPEATHPFVAPVEAQESVTDPPAAGSVVGVAVREVIVGFVAAVKLTVLAVLQTLVSLDWQTLIFSVPY